MFKYVLHIQGTQALILDILSPFRDFREQVQGQKRAPFSLKKDFQPQTVWKVYI